jgi:hypothetical protein
VFRGPPNQQLICTTIQPNSNQAPRNDVTKSGGVGVEIAPTPFQHRDLCSPFSVCRPLFWGSKTPTRVDGVTIGDVPRGSAPNRADTNELAALLGPGVAPANVRPRRSDIEFVVRPPTIGWELPSPACGDQSHILANLAMFLIPFQKSSHALRPPQTRNDPDRCGYGWRIDRRR